MKLVLNDQIPAIMYSKVTVISNPDSESEHVQNISHFFGKVCFWELQCTYVGKMQFELQIAVVRSGLAVVLASAAAAAAVVAAEEPSAGRVLICSCAAYVRSGSSSPDKRFYFRKSC